MPASAGGPGGVDPPHAAATSAPTRKTRLVFQAILRPCYHLDARMEPTHRFLRACRGLAVDRVPIWLMRQAGRYLPEYRAVRARTDFLGLCKTPELACEVTLQPIDLFGLDAAILFSDILLPLEAMGLPLAFTEDGPTLPEPVRDRAAIARLCVPDAETTMPFVGAAVRQLRAALARPRP